MGCILSLRSTIVFVVLKMDSRLAHVYGCQVLDFGWDRIAVRQKCNH